MSGFSLILWVPPEKRDEITADLWESGTTGITEGEEWMQAFFDSSADSEQLCRQFSAFQPSVEPQDDRDWVAHSQSLWRSFPVGKRFWLAPEWDTANPPDGRLRIPIRPGLACGSGWHPATQLCLQALESRITSHSAVLDVGTGSGILAEAAIALGARIVIGCDADHDATVVARRNLPDCPLFTGSVAAVRPRAFDIIVANLDASILTDIAAELRAAQADTLVVSGVQEHQAEYVEQKIARPQREILEQDGWICLIF